MTKLNVGSTYEMRQTPTTKPGYGGKKVKLIKAGESITGGVYLVELLENFTTIISTGETLVKKGTILHIFSKSDLLPLK